MKKSPFLSRVLCALLPLLLPAPAAWGTPSPRVNEITIIPIAANQRGEILFKTIAVYSPYSCYYVTYNIVLGLLVVSANGVWDEVVYKSLGGVSTSAASTPTEEDKKSYREVNEAIALFKVPIYWDSPPPKWRPLLEKYGFTASGKVDPNLGKGEVEWSREGISRRGKLIVGQIRQRTLFNNLSLKGDNRDSTLLAETTSVAASEYGDKPLDLGRKEQPIQCDFYFRGIALFKNQPKHLKRLGASFNVTQGFFPVDGKPHPFIPDPVDLPEVGDEWDINGIDGICIVPER